MAEGGVAALPKRDALPVEQRWDLESVFATVDAWEQAYADVAARAGELERLRGRLAESSAALLDALHTQDALANDAYRVNLYASMCVAVDATNAQSLALLARAEGLAANTAAAAAFIEPELLAIDPAVLAGWLASDAKLAVYAHYLDRLQRRREHVRSAEVEALLAQVSEPLNSSESVFTALADADLSLGSIVDAAGEPVELGQGNLDFYIHAPERQVRQAAWEASADAYLSMKNTFAANYAGAVKRDVFNVRARRYESSLAAALSPESIPEEVFFNLLDTVWKNLPIWQRYFRVRARLLGIDQAHAWDISEAPLKPANAGQPAPIGFEQGVELMLAGLAPLGDEYVRQAALGVEQRWVDWGPNAGKTGGAFSSGMPGHHPFILMSWHDELGSVSTLAHEMGHSMHSFYTWQTQPLIYSDYSMFVAEVASNMNQALLGAHLLETVTERDFLIATIEERMGNNLRYLFTMPILAKFELDAHQRVERGEALTAEDMIAMMADLYAEAYGDAVAIDRERQGITWARFPHLFANFYVFQYATGISAAAQLAAQVREEGPSAARRYIDFLKTGGSEYPVEALKKAGIDMSRPEPVQAAFDMLSGYVDRLETLIDS